MEITPVELIEFGKVLILWGGSLILLGGLCMGIGLIYKDFLYQLASDIIDKI